MVKVFKSQQGMEKVLKSYYGLLKMWDTEYLEQDVQTTYGKTHCIITGNPANPPLLLLHGVGDNSAIMWALNIKELSGHFYCIAVDTLGGPGKSIPNENFTKKTFRQQQWINEIADHYKLQSFNIAGVSNGGTMAYNYAVKESGRVNKVVCMEGGMIIKPLKAIVSTIGMLFPEILMPTRNNMIKIMKKLSSPDSRFIEKNPEIVDHLILLMKNHNQGTMFVHAVEKYDRDAGMAIKDKLLFLIGAFKVDKKKEFLDILDDGSFKYKVIKGAGHGINHEQPEIVDREIIGFVSGGQVQ